MGSPARRGSASHEEVAHALPADAALVEFVFFQPLNFGAIPTRGEQTWGPARYLAFVPPSRRPDAQSLSRAATPGPGFWLRGVDCHSSAARLGSLLAIHRGNRPLQRPRLFTRQPPLSEMGVRQQGRVKRFSRKRDGSSPWSPPLDAARFRPCHLPEMASGRRRLLQQSGVSGSSCLPHSFYEDWMAFVRDLPDEIQTHSEPGLPPPEARFARQETRLIQ
jgi:hypothetical protein